MEIAAETLGVGHGGRPVLAGVDLRIGPGQLVGLIGPNGAGKTTLLRVLAGLTAPLSGRLLYDGTPSPEVPRRALARRVAYLAQGGDVGWELSVAATVALGRLPHRRAMTGPTAEDREAVSRALAVTGIGDLAERRLSTLSGGERARALLARALAVEAEILLADEPVAALDPRHELATLALLRDAARRGAGIVVVLHDISQAARFCDRLVLVARGRILADGRPADILSDAALAEAYGIRVARGLHGTEPFLLPWSPIHADQRETHDDGTD